MIGHQSPACLFTHSSSPRWGDIRPDSITAAAETNLPIKKGTAPRLLDQRRRSLFPPTDLGGECRRWIYELCKLRNSRMKRSALVPVSAVLGEGRIRASQREVSGGADSVSTCRLSQEDAAGPGGGCRLNSPRCCALTPCQSLHTPLPGLLHLKTLIRML